MLENLKGKCVYIAGPMTGYPHFNVDAFDSVEAELRLVEAQEVLNPCNLDRRDYGSDFFEKCPNGTPEEGAAQGFSLRRALKQDLSWICDRADAIVMLPGSQGSKGARIEHDLAQLLGLEVIYL